MVTEKVVVQVKSQKSKVKNQNLSMKLPRTTLILVLLALGLGGFVYFFEVQGSQQRELAQAKEKQIFSFAADDVQALNISTKNSKVSLERNSDSSQKNKWLLKSPSQEAASNASVSYLMDLLVKGESNTTIPTSAKELEKYGLDQPQATIEVKLNNQKAHKLLLGDSDFKGESIYAKKKPISSSNSNSNSNSDSNSNSNGEGKVEVLLVSKDFANAVNRELSEWKQEENIPGKPLPPLTNPPTPSPDVSVSPAASPLPPLDLKPSPE